MADLLQLSSPAFDVLHTDPRRGLCRQNTRDEISSLIETVVPINKAANWSKN